MGHGLANPVSSAGDTALLSCLAVLNHVAVGIYAVDRAGLCTKVNPAALNLLGYTEAECIGRDMHTLMHSRRADGSDYPVSECPLYLARLTGEAVHGLKETFWTKSGKPIRAVCASVPLKNGDDIYGTVITLDDLSSQLAVEHRLQQTEEEQRTVLKQRDAVAQARLQEQQKLAEDQLVELEKLAAVGRLAASISHEINNPLEAVTNLLYLVRADENLSVESNEYLRQAEQELGRVSEIVSQTLRFQRGSTALADCVPESLIESVMALHQGRLHHSNISIDRQHRRSTSFRCAEGDLRQILNNLVGNAIDAMRKEGGVITIRTAPAKDPRSGGKGLRISVSDSGHGMTRITAAQIFEPFYTTKGTGGSGLGLWISNSIAKRHGGRLRVRSRMDDGRRGTTFSLFVPEAAAAV